MARRLERVHKGTELLRRKREALVAALFREARPALSLRTGQLRGIGVAEVVDRPPMRRTPDARGMHPASAGAATLDAARSFEGLADLSLEAAGREALLRRLDEALSRTTRQVNSLEHRVAPELAGAVASMRRTLDEREREEHYRLQRLLRRR